MTIAIAQKPVASKLDHQKLLGFRNLRGLQTSDASLAAGTDLVFNKIGAELPPAPSR